MPAADRDQLLVACLRSFHCTAQQSRLRGTVDIGVDDPDLASGERHGDGDIGGERRFADAALAAGDRDDGQFLAFAGFRDADGGDTLDAGQAGPECIDQDVACWLVEARYIAHQGYCIVVAPDCRGAPLRQALRHRFDRFGLGHDGANSREFGEWHCFSRTGLPITGA